MQLIQKAGGGDFDGNGAGGNGGNGGNGGYGGNGGNGDDAQCSKRGWSGLILRCLIGNDTISLPPIPPTIFFLLLSFPPFRECLHI